MTLRKDIVLAQPLGVIPVGDGKMLQAKNDAQ
jgi:hypothetical protein